MKSPPNPANHAHRDSSGCGGRRSTLGFTAIELVMVVLIAVLLLTLAAPEFIRVIRNNRLANQIAQVSYALNLARSEAVKRAVPVTMCKSSNGTGCETSGVHWESGWIIFSDNDQDQVVDGGDGDTIVQITQALLTGFTLRGSTDLANAVTFLSNGSSAVQGTLVLCASNRTDWARTVTVNLAGRIRNGTDTDNDGTPTALDGTEITSCTSP